MSTDLFRQNRTAAGFAAVLAYMYFDIEGMARIYNHTAQLGASSSCCLNVDIDAFGGSGFTTQLTRLLAFFSEHLDHPTAKAVAALRQPLRVYDVNQWSVDSWYSTKVTGHVSAMTADTRNVLLITAWNEPLTRAAYGAVLEKMGLSVSQ